jgi:hypothetical protein
MQLYGMMNGLEKASATGLDTVARVGQMNMHQQQLKIAQDAAERQRVLFEQQQAKEQQAEQFNNSYVPLTVFHQNIDKQPNRLAHYTESIKALGGDVKVSESGVTLVRPKDVELYYKTGETQKNLIKQEMEMAFKDLDAKNAQITQEISSLIGKDDDKTKARIKKLQELQLEVQTQMGNTYKATTEYQKQIADAEAKPKTEGAPHTITKTSPDGKTEQTFQYNPNSMAVDKYDIPIGQPHPVKSQVIGIVERNKQSVGFKTWTPEAKQQEFMEHMITGTPPVNTRGLAGADRQSYAKEFAQWKVDKGFTPQMASALKSDYKANDMSLKNMTKQEAPMSAFVLNINRQISKVEELYTKNDRTGLRLIDVPLRELRVKAKGSGEEAVKASYLLEISNEIGKLSSGASGSVQQLSDSAKEDWKKVHDVNLSMKEIMKVVNATRDQANMRISTWREAKQEVRRTMQFLGTENSNYQPFDVALPAGVKAEDIAAELARRRKK